MRREVALPLLPLLLLRLLLSRLSRLNFVLLPLSPNRGAEPLPLNLVLLDRVIGDGVALSSSIECFRCIDGLMA